MELLDGTEVSVYGPKLRAFSWGETTMELKEMEPRE